MIALRKWYRRGGGPAVWSRALFSWKNLTGGIITEAPALYKIGVRMCRLFIFMLIGFSRPPPFASHDFSLSVDIRRIGEPMTRARRA